MSSRCPSPTSWPKKPGCMKKHGDEYIFVKKLGERITLNGKPYYPNLSFFCNGLSKDQETVIILLANNGFGDLYVTAPSYSVTNTFLGTVQPVPHHYGTSCIDFGALDKKQLFKAWEFLRREWPGRVLLGLDSAKYGYNVPLHLHVDGSYSEKIFAHGFETKHTYSPSLSVQTIWNRQTGFDTVYQRAKEIYGFAGDYVHPSNPDHTGAKECSATTMALMGAALGAALGWDDKNHTKTAIYAGGGFAAGYFIKKLLCNF